MIIGTKISYEYKNKLIIMIKHIYPDEPRNKVREKNNEIAPKRLS